MITPLVFAFCRIGNDDESRGLVDLLMRRGADVNAQDEQGYAPLHVVGNAEEVRLLLAAGAHLEVKTNEGETPLLMHASLAASPPQLEIVQELVAARADLEADRQEGDRDVQAGQDLPGTRSSAGSESRPTSTVSNFHKFLHPI